MTFFKRKESRKHRKTLIHVYTSCKQTTPLIDTEKVFRSGICICVHYTPLLHLSLQSHFCSWVNTKISLELGICQCVQICEVFQVTPTLFDGDYF